MPQDLVFINPASLCYLLQIQHLKQEHLIDGVLPAKESWKMSISFCQVQYKKVISVPCQNLWIRQLLKHRQVVQILENKEKKD